ncbi:hypothetical protein AX14_002013, partial [Amanita brunnescens Koide BX004]
LLFYSRFKAVALQPEALRANKLPTESSESTQVFSQFKHKKSKDGIWECSPVLSLEAIEANRHSYEHLGESEEVMRELAFPVLSEDEQYLRNAEQQPMSWVVSITRMRWELCSLACSLALMLLAALPASSLHPFSISQSGIKLIPFRPKPLSYRDANCYLYGAVSSMPVLGVEQHAPSLLKMGLTAVIKLDYVWAGNTPRPSSLELVWWEHMKLPNMAACRQFLCRAVNSLSKRKGLETHISWLAVPWITMMHTSSMLFLISAALTLSAFMPAFLSQTFLASQLSYELGGLLVKFPCKRLGGCQQWSVKPSGSSNLSGVETHLPKARTGVLRSVSRPDNVCAASCHSLSVEANWQAHCKPPKAVVLTWWCLYNIVNKSTIWSTTWHLLRTRTGFVPALKPNPLLAGSYCPMNRLSSPELVNLAIIMQHPFALREINQMEHEMCLFTLSHSKGLIWQAPKLPDRTALQRPLDTVVNKPEFRRGMGHSPRVPSWKHLPFVESATLQAVTFSRSSSDLEGFFVKSLRGREHKL